jgi:hypothetical protein
MRDVPNKVAGDLYTTDDFNEGVNKPLRSVLIDSGQGFNSLDDAQILKSIVTLNASRASYKENAGSTGTAYLIELVDTGKQDLFELNAGTTISLVITNANAVTAPTIAFINEPAIPAKTIKRLDGAPLAIGELEAGLLVDLYYDGTDFLVKNLNDATSLQDIEEEQLYTVTGVTGNEYTLSRSVGLNPTAYYNGMIVKFISTQTNTDAVTLKITGLAAVSLVESQSAVMRIGDISNGDLIYAMYSTASNNFRVIKKTERVRIKASTGNNLLEFLTPDANYYTIANGDDMMLWVTGNPIDIDISDDKKDLYILNNEAAYTVNLPDSATLSPNFSLSLVNITVADTVLNFPYNGSDQLVVNGIVYGTSAASLTLPKSAGSVVKIRALQGNWYINADAKASQTAGGYTYYADQATVDAGVVSDQAVSPLTLKNTPFIVNLNVVYPVTSKFFADSPLMVTDPDQIVPGWGVFTWNTLAGGAGARFVHMIATTTAVQTTGVLGSNDAISGSTNGHGLNINEGPRHNHYMFGDIVVPNGGFSTPNQSAARELNNDSFSKYSMAGTHLDPGTGLTGESGNGAPHSHILSIKCYIDYCYRRAG